MRERRVLVTGAAGDIGVALMAAFARDGARVIGLDIEWEALGAAAAAARAAFDDEAEALARIDWRLCDVADEASVDEAVADAVATLGGLDVLINNAAAAVPHGTVEETAVADWRRAFDVNLTGAMLMSRATLPALRRDGGGVIVNMASQLGQRAKAGRAAYGAAKAALLHLTRIMALDHAQEGVRVVSLSPGAVLTGRVIRRYGSVEAAEAALAPDHPMGRLGRPEEVAAAALYLASEEAGFMTGADLRLDGGYAA
ncbi:MAG: SDR family oxidoreductase [Alphaproteobacteria bacterium]|nr:SDR family oxidoreductase [Alphaproteobacteria bacterium]